MKPTMISDIAQKMPSPPVAADSPPQEAKGGASQVGAVLSAKDKTPEVADKVSISTESQQSVTEVAKQDAKDETRKVDSSGESTSRGMAQVQFVYDLKGELSVRYMDTKDKLIYQIPSELVVRMREISTKSNSPVDTKV